MEHTYRFPAKLIFNREIPALVDGVDNPFTWSAEISSNRLDAYFTRMAESTLRNFAQDAAAGVTFLDSHNARNLGYGQSIGAMFEIENDISRVVSDFYTVPGLNFGSALTYQSTDDFIRALKSRLIRDVSVGFYGGDMVCDICGGSFYDWRVCTHWPGVEYAIGEQGDKTIVATFQITDAHLAEVSAVYDGATPGAMILRATEMSQAGVLSPSDSRRLEMQYRFRLPSPAHNWRGVSNELVELEDKKPMDEIKTVLEELGLDPTDPAAAIRQLAADNSRLTGLADEGRAYRSDLIEQAISEGVRAMGNSFPAETYREMFASSNLDTIKLLRDRWSEQAARVIPGGRQTVDTETKPAARPNGPVVPNAAYKS